MDISSLTGADVGVWTVRTASATYVVDLDAGSLVRSPGVGVVLGDFDVAQLRRDGEWLPLLGIVLCRVGEPFVSLLGVRCDGVPTLRRSTPVVEIAAAA